MVLPAYVGALDGKRQRETALITGASSGIGLDLAQLMAPNFDLIITARNQAALEKIALELQTAHGNHVHVIPADLTLPEAPQQIFAEIDRRALPVDILINNAGYGLSGALEDLLINEIKVLFDTNFFGLIRATQAVLPIMRNQRSGIIVNISSGLGRFGIATSSAYVSSKFAVEGLTESMSYELEPFGIKTILVEPGIIKTNFIKAAVLAQKSKDPNSPYFQFMNNMDEGMKKLIENSESPEYVARVVLDAINDSNPKLRYLAGKDVEHIMEIKNKMSDEDFHNMIKNMSS